MTESIVPEGFKPFRTDDTFNDVVAPLYFKLDEEKGPVIGMVVGKKHCNYIGITHGGAMMTLTDIVLSGAVCHVLGKYTSTPTVSISFDFMAAAQQGDWIYVDILSVNLTRTLGFVNAMIEGPQGHVARVSGCFKLPNDIDALPGMAAEDYYQWRMSSG